MKKIGRRIALLAGLALLPALVLGAGGALGASPSSGTVSFGSDVTWTGGPFVVSNPVACTGVDPACDPFQLTVQRPDDGKSYRLEITVSTANTADDFDVFLYDSEGSQVDASTNGGTPPELIVVTDPPNGTYEVLTQAWLVDPGASYSAKATLKEVLPKDPPPDPDSVKWSFDADAAEAKATTPLRIVLVGFNPGELDAESILSLIPDSQRPGVLIPHLDTPGGESDDCTANSRDTTLVNHGRCYFRESTPPLVPWEFNWKPELIYAPAAFADGLFASMRANSTTGELGGRGYKAYLEQYNATRGIHRGVANQVTPQAPVRFVDAEKVEDWIAANANAHLGFPIGPPLGKVVAGKKPGYTVFVLNTWDSPQALEHLKPQNEYHVFKIVRIDPDTAQDEGIDWARVWGGRYREMILDLGAAPNPYEAETWGNNGDTIFGSAAYDPPLWEYRANAPRPVVPAWLVDPEQSEQAVNPGATWDAATLSYNIGRFANEAASFRFAHSYLYEPRPQTGKYYLSSNVWHDAKAEQPWPTDLSKLYNEQAVFDGLRSLVPYFEFEGDTVYQYLRDGGADFTADQAMLDDAKAAGDDIAGVPHSAMNTLVAMDYFDAEERRDRFYRGGQCTTTIPNLNVAVEKHYAWALPVIVAGIAPDRAGVPWGFLASVSDVTKYNGADRDPAMQMFHPAAYSGTFSYTAIHELSHYLGLAHPHDTVGASKIDGETVYWDGFSWSFNSTAAPTTYSHDELYYAILDQENLTRGHAAYYLRWTQEALAEAGQAYFDRGIETIGELPPLAASFRAKAIKKLGEAKKQFAKFNFIKATFAAQDAWRSAATYRDRALGLKRGTSELEKGSKATGPGGCPSATAK